VGIPSLSLDKAADKAGETAVAKATTEVVYNRGRPMRVDGVRVGDNRLIVSGKLLAIARLRDEWYDQINSPETVVAALKRFESKPDLFSFWQRLPDTSPIYPYYHEWEALSAIPLQTYKHWWEKQIKTDTRKKIKRPEKRGIELKVVEMTDEFVQSVREIFDETPVRRGRRFSHYGKSLEQLREMLSRDLPISEFVGAYHEGSLVGFVKLVYAEGRFANPGLIVSKLGYRKKYVNNALIAKAVELCTDRSIPYLTYTNWRRGSQADFLMRHGFEKILIPRYWVALTEKGRLALRLGLHHSLRSHIPAPILGFLLDTRKSIFDKWNKVRGRETGSE
jgi:hypothetical protein